MTLTNINIFPSSDKYSNNNNNIIIIIVIIIILEFFSVQSNCFSDWNETLLE